MRLTTRFIALGLASAMLVACAHKDKDAPLAFAPADTPYVLANLDTLDADTRAALLTQADAQLPSQLAQLNATADRFAEKDPDGARLLHALTAEFKGKTIETFAHDAGINLGGYHALYGIGLAPVARIELSDHKAFDRFVDRLETAYGTQLDVLREGAWDYLPKPFSARADKVTGGTSSPPRAPRSYWPRKASTRYWQCCRRTRRSRCCARHWGWTGHKRVCRTTVVWPSWPKPTVTPST